MYCVRKYIEPSISFVVRHCIIVFGANNCTILTKWGFVCIVVLNEVGTITTGVDSLKITNSIIDTLPNTFKVKSHVSILGYLMVVFKTLFLATVLGVCFY